MIIHLEIKNIFINNGKSSDKRHRKRQLIM